MPKKQSSTILVETAIVASFAMSLSLLPDLAGWFTPSLGAIPLVVFSLKRGLRYGLLAGLIWGLLHFILGRVYYLSFYQVLIEYLLAFTCMGLAGLTSHKFQDALKKGNLLTSSFWAILGITIAVLTRYFWHFLAGVIFWSDYAPKGMSPYLYSFMVNGSACGLTFILCVIIFLAILKFQSKLLKN